MLVISCRLKYSFTECAEKKACHFKEMLGKNREILPSEASEVIDYTILSLQTGHREFCFDVRVTESRNRLVGEQPLSVFRCADSAAASRKQQLKLKDQ